MVVLIDKAGMVVLIDKVVEISSAVGKDLCDFLPVGVEMDVHGCLQCCDIRLVIWEAQQHKLLKQVQAL